MTDNSQKLALSESFERVAKVAEERQAFNEAMDRLIAQDADLIDMQPMLKPCPFCGGVQIEAFHHIDRGWGASWHVECAAEECGNSTCHQDTEANAIAAWNKRQPSQGNAEIIAENARLREALFQIGYDFGSGYLAVEIAREALQEQSK